MIYDIFCKHQSVYILSYLKIYKQLKIFIWTSFHLLIVHCKVMFIFIRLS